MIIDLDHFKRFNDTFGHDGGDAVLNRVSALFANRVRVEDIACRYEGEEFVLVLPNASLAMTYQRGESLCAEAKQLQVLHNGNTLGAITISIGAAAFPEHGSTPQELLAAADAALYQAKSRGRDRVVTAMCRGSEGATIAAVATR